MHHRIVIASQGKLGLVATPIESESPFDALEIPRELVGGFQSSFVSGLVLLSSSSWGQQLATWHVEFGFWREFTRKYFASLCRQYSSNHKQWTSVQPPETALFEEWLGDAPPMLGIEHLNPDVLRQLWGEIDAHTQVESGRHEGGLAGYLRSIDTDWNLIGRVTFHLAENKRNAELPFAFMATYTQGQAKDGSPQHVPLAEALRDSIASKDTTKLDQLLEPVSRAAKSVPLVEQLLETRKLFAPQAWAIPRAYEFLKSLPTMEQAGLVIRVPNWWNSSRPPRPQVSVRIGSKEPSRFGLDGLDLKVGVTIDGEPLSESELKELLNVRDGLALMRGKWVQIDPDRLKTALDHWKALKKQNVQGVDFLKAMRMLSGASIGEGSDQAEASRWVRVASGEWLQQTLRSLREPGNARIDIDPESVVQADLRHYQSDGVRWLWFANQLGLGVCLADDMGLGKTLQVIALIGLLRRSEAKTDKEPRSPCLIVVPTSLMGNWQRELQKFAPQLRAFVAHRSCATIEDLRSLESDPIKHLADKDVVIVTYGSVRNAKWLTKATWQLVVLDEAQAIKNSGSQQAKAIKAIPARTRIVMTGTPIENHLGDLWSLFDFSSPGLLGSATEFKRFISSSDQRQREERLASLRKLIQPYVLRRMKTDPTIVPELPAKTELRVDCNLSTAQAALYRQVIKDLEKSLDIASGIQRRGMVLATLMQLKQICNHPDLYLKGTRFSDQESGKFAVLRRLCEDIREKREKVLVFSQFQTICDPLCEFLAEVFGRPGLVLTGKTSPKERGKLVSEFQEPFGPSFFVISVKAGGTGLNLTEACHVVHFDRWWNPAIEDQATDRAFRIGQKQNVLVHKFVTSGTLEERIDDLIQSKKSISKEIFDKAGEINLTEMSDDQLLQFISLDLNKATSN